MTLLEKIHSLPEVLKVVDSKNKAIDLTVQLLKSGKITDVECATLIKGFPQTVINITGAIDNSVTIDGDVIQSTVGQGAVESAERKARDFWENVRDRRNG